GSRPTTRAARAEGTRPHRVVRAACPWPPRDRATSPPDRPDRIRPDTRPARDSGDRAPAGGGRMAGPGAAWPQPTDAAVAPRHQFFTSIVFTRYARRWRSAEPWD